MHLNKSSTIECVAIACYHVVRFLEKSLSVYEQNHEILTYKLPSNIGSHISILHSSSEDNCIT